MAHPLITHYDGQISIAKQAVDGNTVGLIRLKKKGVPDLSLQVMQTKEALRHAQVKLEKLLRERDAVLRDFEELDRMRNMVRDFMSWRDSLKSDSKNSSSTEAVKFMSTAAASRITTILDRACGKEAAK